VHCARDRRVTRAQRRNLLLELNEDFEHVLDLLEDFARRIEALERKFGIAPAAETERLLLH
jgi:hypothetical protein